MVLTVIYCSRKDMPQPGALGWFDGKDSIYIVDTLPEDAQLAVYWHEVYHWSDKSTNVLWREIKANWYALRKWPRGWLTVLWLTLTSLERMRYYWGRLRTGK
jgi:hypothetical protein